MFQFETKGVPLAKSNPGRAVKLFLAAAALVAQTPGWAIEPASFHYADTADAVSLSPIVAVATVSKAKRLKGDLAAEVADGYARFLITVKLSALLRSTDSLPEQIQYLLDVPLDAKGRPPKLKKAKIILAAAPVADRPGFVRLTSKKAQMAWSPEREAQVRAIITESVSADAPPIITGVGNAFHVEGSLPGESETQIFLQTARNDAVSLNILRRPGEAPRWAVALGEMIDDSARPPAPNTLLWYRLACFLPGELPRSSTASLSPKDAATASSDYRLVIDALGPCNRTGA